MAVTPFKVILSHRFCYQSKAVCDLLLVISTNLHPILHHFEVIVDYSNLG